MTNVVEITPKKEVITTVKAVERLITIYTESAVLALDAKAVLEEAKEANLDTATIAKAAKLIATGKELDFIDKATFVIDLINELDDVL